MTYEDLLIEHDDSNLIIKEKPLQSSDGRIKNNRIAIRKDIPTVKKACVLAEELGHYHTTIGNIIEQQTIEDIKQERKARIWAYDKLIGLSGLIREFEHGCHGRYEIAEYLDVTEDFLQDAVDYYQVKYGRFATIDHYIIRFIPYLVIAKML